MVSPYSFYQYWLNVEDASVLHYLRVFTDRTREEIAEVEVSLTQKPYLREAQRLLASDVTTLVHGAAATAAAQEASAALFGGGAVDGLDVRTLLDATTPCREPSWTKGWRWSTRSSPPAWSTAARPRAG